MPEGVGRQDERRVPVGVIVEGDVGLPVVDCHELAAVGCQVDEAPVGPRVAGQPDLGPVQCRPVDDRAVLALTYVQENVAVRGVPVLLAAVPDGLQVGTGDGGARSGVQYDPPVRSVAPSHRVGR